MPSFFEVQDGSLVEQLSGLSSSVILAAFVVHLVLFGVLWMWYRRDLRAIADGLDDFTRGLKHRSVLSKSTALGTQIDAFVADIRDVIADRTRTADRKACLQRMHILDEKRGYLESLSFETTSNAARTMIEAYPLAGVLGTILAIGAALQAPPTPLTTNAVELDAIAAAVQPETTTMLSRIVERFGDAIWSTFFGLAAAIILMFVSSLLEPRFSALNESRSLVGETVAGAKRELALSASVTDEEA